MPTLIALLIFVMSASTFAAPVPLEYQILHERAHPHRAFTQGLLIHRGQFVESSGLYRQSFVQRYPVTDGEPGLVRHQSRRDFSEGLAFTGKHYWLLTWQQGLARKLDAELRPVSIARYQGEGWGLTFDGRQLIMSNGSAELSFRDPDSFELTQQLAVTYKNQPLNAINELEFAEGLIWANVWFSPMIYAIDPANGQVVSTVDLSALVDTENKSPDAVLNGIAYDADDRTFWVTGKRWRKLYQLRITPGPGAITQATDAR
ncbi:glutaminyl-peptide cyclotransferase [Simiduia agarivorans]|uniref:glutaminyl-peptide cyclotransferase n=1 Tax=Simiduia agarivorans TaxID=447471 RepID=UPI00138ABD5E|nr:glutaminyl-peptide cyclotransferase [Simiduia agarivorans]